MLPTSYRTAKQLLLLSAICISPSSARGAKPGQLHGIVRAHLQRGLKSPEQGLASQVKSEVDLGSEASSDEGYIAGTTGFGTRDDVDASTGKLLGQKHAGGPRTGHLSYVTQQGGHLVLDGRTFRFSSFNAPELMEGNDDFEAEDTMRTLAELGAGVTRTYTLNVAGTSPKLPANRGHIIGWNAKKRNWNYDEAMFRKERGYGTVETNWVGNIVDLIIHRKNSSWDYATARNTVDFWTDRTMIDSFKQIITYLLNRRNTINGVRYGDDPVILAWQTGNELNCGEANDPATHAPPPGPWTVEIAQHIRSLAPRTLVADGTYGRDRPINDTFAIEALKSEHVHLFSTHYYQVKEYARVKPETAYIQNFGKAYMVREYGFLPTAEMISDFLKAAEEAKCSGSLIWSLRPHAFNGGFKTHAEDENNAAYHVPGWPNPTTPSSWVRPPNWDTKEHNIVDLIYKSSFSINGLPRPKEYPIPAGSPFVWLVAGSRNITWQGAAWANSYEVWLSRSALFGQHERKGRPSTRGKWINIAKGVLDAVANGTLAFPLPTDASGSLRIRGLSLDGKLGEWSNTIKV